MIKNFNLWRVSSLALFIVLIAGACSNLAGDVEIVGTVPPQSQTVLPLELPGNPPDVANGQRIYQENCTRCHGISGAGDGEMVADGSVPRMGSFLDPAHVRQQSVESYYDIITNGNLLNLMPFWSDSLSVQERWDVAMYVYTLQYSEEQIALGETLIDNPSGELQLAGDTQLAEESPLDGEEAFAAVAYERVQSVQNWGANLANTAQIELDAISFSGLITQGSPNAVLPDGIRVQLQYGDFIEIAEVVDGVIDANGQFTFTDIPVLDNSTYFAVAFYDGYVFVSEPVLSRDLQEINAVDITFYERSNAPNIVNLTRIEFVLEYLTVPDLGTGIVVSQWNTYENPTDYVFHLSPEGQDIRVSLLISLPVGAVILDDPDQDNFIAVQEQYALIDTRPVYPGEHFVKSSYFIPYNNLAQTLDIPLNNHFSGEVSIMVINPELTIAGETMSYNESVNIATGDNPRMASIYTGTVDLQAGDSLIFDVEGNITLDTGSDAVLDSNQIVPILAGVAIVFILLIAAVVFYVRSGRDNTQREIDRVVMEISRIESMHDAGQINHDAFQQKRADLKARLAELMSESQTNE